MPAATQAATSGALQGGQTARFLGAGAEPAAQAQGRELVDDLKRGDDRPAVTTAVKAPVAPTVQQDVLSELSASPTPTSATGSRSYAMAWAGTRAATWPANWRCR